MDTDPLFTPSGRDLSRDLDAYTALSPFLRLHAGLLSKWISLDTESLDGPQMEAALGWLHANGARFTWSWDYERNSRSKRVSRSWKSYQLALPDGSVRMYLGRTLEFERKTREPRGDFLSRGLARMVGEALDKRAADKQAAMAAAGRAYFYGPGLIARAAEVFGPAVEAKA